MNLLNSLMMQLRNSVNRCTMPELNFYHLGRLHGFIYSLVPSDHTMALRNEANFLVQDYAYRHGAKQ